VVFWRVAQWLVVVGAVGGCEWVLLVVVRNGTGGAGGGGAAGAAAGAQAGQGLADGPGLVPVRVRYTCGCRTEDDGTVLRWRGCGRHWTTLADGASEVDLRRSVDDALAAWGNPR
jgi:hypothetical protein